MVWWGMTISETFKKQVADYLDATGMKPSIFSMKVMGDPTFVSGLYDGRNCKMETIDRVLKWIDENPPEAGA